MRLLGLHCCWGPVVHTEVPDGGWGWAVALAFFVVEVCTYGTLKSLGVFLQDLMEEFEETNSRVSWVVSICAFMFTFTAPLSTWLSRRFGPRPVVMTGGFLISLGTISSAFTNSIHEMYITVGIVSGLGYCLAFLPTLTLLAQYFSRRRSLVTSAASSGESVAIFAFAPALSSLKQLIGWRYCLLVLGVVQSSVIGCGLLLRPIVVRRVKEASLDADSLSLKQMQAVYELENEQTKTSLISGGSEDSGVTSLSSSNLDLRAEGSEGSEGSEAPSVKAEKDVEEDGGESEDGGAKLLDLSVLKDAAFVCYALFGLFATLGFFAPQLYVIELSKSRGVDPSWSSYMLSAMAAAEMVGRLSMGAALNRVCCRKTLLLLGCVLLLCLVLVAFALVWEFWGLLVCCALYGLLLGAIGSSHIPLLAEDDVVGIRRMPSCVGIYVFLQSFAGLAGPPLSGVLVDATENYGAAFFCCAAGVAVSAVCLALVGPAKSGMCHKIRKRKSDDEEQRVPENDLQEDFLELDLKQDKGVLPPHLQD